MNSPKIHILIHDGTPTVFLYDGDKLVGGWTDVKPPTMGGAEIAAEVLKVALPNAVVVTNNAADWWASVKRFEDAPTFLA